MQPETNGEIVAELRKISQLLALIYAKDADKNDAIVRLDNAGMSKVEIAELLGMPASSVRGALFREKKKPKPKKSK